MLYYHIISLGCAKNFVDSERFAQLFHDYGFRYTADPAEANIVLVNTCGFLQCAMVELDDTLFVLLDTIDRRRTKVVFTGCVMNRALKDFQEIYPEIKTWIGLKDFAAMEEYLQKVLKVPKAQRIPRYSGKRRAFQKEKFFYLRIADGCDNHCSYCMIPSIRGHLKSEPIEALVKEAKAHSRKYKELILIAQDSCMYGTDIYGKKALPELIDALHNIEGFEWIRILYMHPDHFEPEWVELWKKYPKLLPYFEIPIQHVSDRILKLMNRKKGYQELKELFHHIRKHIPESIFRTTFIVGYPTETTRDRELILRFLDEVDILHAGSFGYSPEKHCDGYKTLEDFNYREVYELTGEFQNQLDEMREKKLQKYVGTIQKCLVEQYIKCYPGVSGRLWFQSPEIDGLTLVGPAIRSLAKQDFVEVRIVDCDDQYLYAIPTNPEFIRDI